MTIRPSPVSCRPCCAHAATAIEVYHSGDALLEGLREGAAPDVILLDVLMPGPRRSRDAAGRSASRIPRAQVVMLSGGQTPATIVEAVRLGAIDYVVKPGDPDGVGEVALEAAIRNALERAVPQRRSRAAAHAGRPRTRTARSPAGAPARRCSRS